MVKIMDIRNNSNQRWELHFEYHCTKCILITQQ